MRKRSLLILFIFSLAIFLSLVDYSYSQKKLKVFISVDMEGIGGIVSGDHTSSSGRDYGRARKWMTEEVNAAIRGAQEAGATEIVVNDSHGSMRNVIASDLNPAAYLITGSPKPLSMMQGIDKSFDAVILIGYHARAGTKDGVLDHTYSGGSIYSVKVNGKEMSEADLNALIAGWFDVPVVLVTGDSTICEHSKKSIGEELEVASVKDAIGRYAAKTLTPQKAQELIQKKTKIALEKRKKIRPFKMKPPFRFEVSFLRSSMADGAELIPQVERTGGRNVSFVIDDYIKGFKLLRALIYLAR